MSKTKKAEVVEVEVQDTTTALAPKQGAEVTQLLQMAIQTSGSVEAVRELLEMRRELKAEWAKEQFNQALSQLQSELPPIEKNKVVYNKDGRTVRYKYSTLDKIIETVQPYLKKYGFSFNFSTEFEENAVTVTCHLRHQAGHEEQVKFKAPIKYSGHMLPIQEWGSALTYAKRYSLSLALGLTSDEDTDGDTGQEEVPEALKSKPTTTSQVTPDVLKHIWEGYLEVCGNKPHAINAIKKVVGDKPKEEWDLRDIASLKADLIRRRQEKEAENLVEFPPEREKFDKEKGNF